MIRMAITLAVCGVAIAAAAPAGAQSTEQPPASATPPETAPPPLAPPENGLGMRASPEERKAPENSPAESRPPETAEGRYSFSRVQDGYLRLDNRSGQVSFCSKRTVGWTCQLAPEDRAAFESEIARLQEENVALKRDLLGRGLPLPGSMKAEPPVVRNDKNFSLPSDPNFDRMKDFVEQVWRRLVALIVSLQKDVLKKS